jgi:methionyl-tRNA synthetase
MISFNEFKQVELKVAEVVEVTPHPNADKLYVMQVKLGEETRQLVAGMRPYCTAEHLMGKKIVIVANLEPAVLRGEKSEGMLLAAQDGDRVVCIVPEEDVASGSGIL